MWGKTERILLDIDIKPFAAYTRLVLLFGLCDVAERPWKFDILHEIHAPTWTEWIHQILETWRLIHVLIFGRFSQKRLLSKLHSLNLFQQSLGWVTLPIGLEETLCLVRPFVINLIKWSTDATTQLWTVFGWKAERTRPNWQSMLFCCHTVVRRRCPNTGFAQRGVPSVEGKYRKWSVLCGRGLDSVVSRSTRSLVFALCPFRVGFWPAGPMDPFQRCPRKQIKNLNVQNFK